MKKSARLVFFGTEDFSNASLEALIEAGWKLVAVVTKPNSRSGRGQQTKSPAVKRLAENQNIPVFQPSHPKQVVNEIASLSPTHGILVSYGAIIPQDLIDVFPGGIINLHPSLLPLYRGPSPVEAAILSGDKQTGVSLMQLNSKMDEGPVYAQKTMSISDEDDQISLSGKLSAFGAHFLIEKLHLITSGFLQPKPQDDSKATYSKLLKKEDGAVDFKSPAEIIERQVRAFRRFPKSAAKLGEHKVIITKSRVASGPDDGSLVVKCLPGWLEVQELIAPSGKTISGADFLKGYKLP